MLRIDPRTQSASLFGPILTHDIIVWRGGTAGADGCIYGTPHKASANPSTNPNPIPNPNLNPNLRFDPRTKELSTFGDLETLEGDSTLTEVVGSRYFGGVLGPKVCETHRTHTHKHTHTHTHTHNTYTYVPRHTTHALTHLDIQHMHSRT